MDIDSAWLEDFQKGLEILNLEEILKVPSLYEKWSKEARRPAAIHNIFFVGNTTINKRLLFPADLLADETQSFLQIERDSSVLDCFEVRIRASSEHCSDKQHPPLFHRLRCFDVQHPSLLEAMMPIAAESNHISFIILCLDVFRSPILLQEDLLKNWRPLFDRSAQCLRMPPCIVAICLNTSKMLSHLNLLNPYRGSSKTRPATQEIRTARGVQKAVLTSRAAEMGFALDAQALHRYFASRSDSDESIDRSQAVKDLISNSWFEVLCQALFTTLGVDASVFYMAHKSQGVHMNQLLLAALQHRLECGDYTQLPVGQSIMSKSLQIDEASASFILFRDDFQRLKSTASGPVTAMAFVDLETLQYPPRLSSTPASLWEMFNDTPAFPLILPSPEELYGHIFSHFDLEQRDLPPGSPLIKLASKLRHPATYLRQEDWAKTAKALKARSDAETELPIDTRKPEPDLTSKASIKSFLSELPSARPSLSPSSLTTDQRGGSAASDARLDRLRSASMNLSSKDEESKMSPAAIGAARMFRFASATPIISPEELFKSLHSPPKSSLSVSNTHQGEEGTSPRE